MAKHGRARGPTVSVVQSLLRCPDGGGPAVCAALETLPGLSAAIDHGEQRQARHARGRPGRGRYRPRLLGRARNQRPALFLPADPSRDPAHSLRLHRVREAAQSPRPAPRHPAGERRCPDRGPGLRQDVRTGDGGGDDRLARAPPGLRGQPSFDHRGSFQTRMFGWKGRLTSEQTGEIAAAKRVIYDGFTAAVAAGVPRDKAGILVDEQFGASILRDAEAHGYVTACPAEKSGQEEFDFEYGEYFTDHIEVVRPTFCKVLVRYNPQGDPALNRRQADRLKRLSWYLRNKSRSRFMFELLVPAEQGQLDRLGGDTKAYDLELRPRLMVQAIQQLQDAQIEPDIWKVEGLDRLEDCERVVATARRGGRDTVGCIVLGRGEDA